MTDLRTAARQALEALEGKRYTACGWRSDCDKAITALRAALADHYCDTHCTWADHAAGCALADGDNLSPTEPVAWYHVPHPGNGISPVVSMFQQHEPSLYAVAVPLFIREQL